MKTFLQKLFNLEVILGLLSILFIVFLLWLLTACSTTHIPPSDRLYQKPLPNRHQNK